MTDLEYQEMILKQLHVLSKAIDGLPYTSNTVFWKVTDLKRNVDFEAREVVKLINQLKEKEVVTNDN